MSKMRKNIKRKEVAEDSKAGFTIIEVMLVLAVTGIMLLGLIGSSYTTIARQRYSDALNSFGEYLSRIYSEVISPESSGKGSSADVAIIGKILVFGEDYDDDRDRRSVYSATLVGTTNIARPSDQSFLEELVSPESKVQIFCGNEDRATTVSSYTPLWETELMGADQYKEEPFKGTVIIARTPTSNTVHTVFARGKTYNLKDQCNPENKHANTAFMDDLKEEGMSIYKNDSANQVKICLKSHDSPISREIDLAIDGSNTSAVSILPESESQCR